MAQQNKHWTSEELQNKVVVVKPMTPSEEAEVQKMLVKARIQIMFNYPFFGYLIMHLQLTPDYTIDTAATDSKMFYYNPYFIKALSAPERTWIIIHEVMHAALKHIWRCGTRIPQKWNYACDYAIHSIMQQFLDTCEKEYRVALRMPKNCLYSSEYDNMSAEQIYSILPEDYQKRISFGAGGDGKSDKSNNDNDNSNGGGGQQTPLDDHSRWYTKNQQNDATINQRTWDGRLAAAAQFSSQKNRGNVPAFLQRLIDKIVHPKKNWRLILNEFIEYICIDYAFTPPDNRYIEEEFGDIKMPSFSDEDGQVKNLVFWIDTSGSMSNDDIKMVYSELYGAIQQFSKLHGYLGFFDAVATELKEFEDIDDVQHVKPVGGGGTDFDVGIKQTFKQFDPSEITCIIYMTDGYCPWPDEDLLEDVPMLWVITNEETNPPFGTVIRLDPQEYEK